jgi:hypothetical protein
MKRAILIAALYAWTCGALGQERTERERQMLRALDADKDGRVSAIEARSGREAIERLTEADAASGGSTAGDRRNVPASALFRRTDRNSDGYLSQSELWQAPVWRGGGWMATDGDNDGRIAPSEFTSLDSVRARQ